MKLHGRCEARITELERRIQDLRNASVDLMLAYRKSARHAEYDAQDACAEMQRVVRGGAYEPKPEPTP